MRLLIVVSLFLIAMSCSFNPFQWHSLTQRTFHTTLKPSPESLRKLESLRKTQKNFVASSTWDAMKVDDIALRVLHLETGQVVHERMFLGAMTRTSDTLALDLSLPFGTLRFDLIAFTNEDGIENTESTIPDTTNSKATTGVWAVSATFTVTAQTTSLDLLLEDATLSTSSFARDLKVNFCYGVTPPTGSMVRIESASSSTCVNAFPDVSSVSSAASGYGRLKVAGHNYPWTPIAAAGMDFQKTLLMLNQNRFMVEAEWWDGTELRRSFPMDTSLLNFQTFDPTQQAFFIYFMSTTAGPPPGGTTGGQPAISFATGTTTVAEDTNPDMDQINVMIVPPPSTGSSYSVSYALSGTATQSADYNDVTPTLGTLTFDSANPTQMIQFQRIYDGVTEGDETVLITLQNPTNGAVLGSLPTHTYTIAEDDGPYVANVVAGTPSVTRRIGDTVNVLITFSQSVNVTGSPRILLETGSTDRYANYSSGSGSGVLTFSYTPSPGDATADLDYVSTNSLELNAGSIVSSTGSYPASIVLPAPGSASSLSQSNVIIDTVPVVTSFVGWAWHNISVNIFFQGENFHASSTVDIGGQPCTSVNVPDPQNLSCMTSGSYTPASVQPVIITTGPFQSSTQNIHMVGNPGAGGLSPAAWLVADFGVTQSGGFVSNWNSKSPASISAEQTNAPDQPIYNSNDGTIGGFPTVEFDGTAGFLALTDYAYTFDVGTWFVLLKNGSSAAASGVVFADGAASAYFKFPVIQPSYWAGQNGTTPFSTSTTPDNNWHIHRLVRSGANLTYFLDSTSIQSNSNGDGSGTSLAGTFRIGWGGGANLTGKIMEIIYYPNALSGSESLGVERYMRCRYGGVLGACP